MDGPLEIMTAYWVLQCKSDFVFKTSVNDFYFLPWISDLVSLWHKNISYEFGKYCRLVNLSIFWVAFLFSAYELWFKQIIYEIDSIRDIFMGSEKLQQFSLMSLTAETLKPEAPSLDERVMLDINKRFWDFEKIIYYLLVLWSP